MPSPTIDLIRALSRCHAFIGLDPEQLRLIEPIVQIREYSLGDSVLLLDSPDCDLYIILDGELRVIDETGREVADLGPGASVGEVALLDQQPRSASVIATAATTVGFIPAMHMWMLMERRPEIGKTVLFNIGRVLAGRLRSATKQS